MSATESPNLTTALAAFQSDLPTIGKSNTATVKSDKGTYTYNYADLADVSAAILPSLAPHGLAWSTQPTMEDGHFLLRYQLRHVSGETIEGAYPLPAPGNAQGMGSAITYARRYTLCSVTGVAPAEDDDDGASASSASRPAKRAPAKADGQQADAATATPGPPRGGTKALRIELAKAGTGLGMDINAINADFFDWSTGGSIGEADEGTLQQYLGVLQKRLTATADHG